jgi:hypothetical protein
MKSRNCLSYKTNNRSRKRKGRLDRNPQNRVKRKKRLNPKKSQRLRRSLKRRWKTKKSTRKSSIPNFHS